VDNTARDQEGAAANFLAHWPKNVAAVEYFLGAVHAWVLVVSVEGKVSAHPLKRADGRLVETPELVERVHRFLQNIEGQAAKMFNRVMTGEGFDHRWQDELHTLSNELLPEAAMKQLRVAKVVVVVPQHILHYFPFAALVTKKDRDPSREATIRPRHLIDEAFTLVYAPSLTTWALLREREARPIAEVNAVGLVKAPDAEPLPGVDEDLKNLGAAFKQHLRTLEKGPRATEANTKTLFDRPGLLFLATHGLNDADRPLDSYLILLPDPAAKESDGRLRARDIFAREVHADLLVMSACYSGLGDRSPLPGDDLFGLQRAFLQSGARTVVSGLWDVYDGTAPELMNIFFQELKAGKTAPVALATSQRAFLRKLRQSSNPEPWLHPYFWAVYTAAGDDRTVMSK
jgi:CHAT domain-containing protein